jgi:hypothetical protein
LKLLYITILNYYLICLILYGSTWSYSSWIYNYLCNQGLSPLKLWVRTPFMAMCTCVLDTTLCDKVCQRLATGRWFSLGTLIFSTNKIDGHVLTEIILKVALNTINQNKPILFCNLSVSELTVCFSVKHYVKAILSDFPIFIDT